MDLRALLTVICLAIAPAAVAADYVILMPVIDGQTLVESDGTANLTPVNFTDTITFDSDGSGVSVQAVGYSHRTNVQTGRAHPTYTYRLVLTNVVVVDAWGNIVGQPVDVPFWASPECTPKSPSCSPYQTDSWSGVFALPAGTYTMVLMGWTAHNGGAGVSYGYSVY